jgi:hypothetical protein
MQKIISNRNLSKLAQGLTFRDAAKNGDTVYSITRAQIRPQFSCGKSIWCCPYQFKRFRSDQFLTKAGDAIKRKHVYEAMLIDLPRSVEVTIKDRIVL